MTMGLKIHKMIREDGKEPTEIREEAKRRKEMSDSILEIIYNKIINKKDKGPITVLEDETESWDE
jgi:hypothetical protein